MSTFNGVVKEFPNIRNSELYAVDDIASKAVSTVRERLHSFDFFRDNPAFPPPLAFFLSHVHTDHLHGLDSFRGRPIYCSSATRELLLRLEKKPHRINFAKGVFESRIVTFKHLSLLLYPIPLNTPTTIELTPSSKLRVTLFDANHCPGAVGFLIEGHGKAVIYTGDIRSEPWWVNALARQPALIPYTTTGLRTIDTIYLDTTFATKSKPFREFPTKQDGLGQLLRLIAKYPPTTVFHVNSWTFGYEEVWIALAAFFNTKVHVDPYKWRLYTSFLKPKDGHHISDSTSLAGFNLANDWHDGCLTEDPSGRLHSCEPGHGCDVITKPNTVLITPILSRLSTGEEIAEVGAGGGYSDLAQLRELDLSDKNAAASLLEHCMSIKDEEERRRAVDLVTHGMASLTRRLTLPAHDEEDAITLQALASLLARPKEEPAALRPSAPTQHKPSPACADSAALPREIHYAYSRHSSFNELRHLVSIFKPRDLYPCTVNEAGWDPTLSMQSLFGDLCSTDIFAHDKEMAKKYWERIDREARALQDDDEQETQSTNQMHSSQNGESQQIAVLKTTDTAAQRRGGMKAACRALGSQDDSSLDQTQAPFVSAPQTQTRHDHDTDISQPDFSMKRKRSAENQNKSSRPMKLATAVPDMASLPATACHTPMRPPCLSTAEEADQAGCQGQSQNTQCSVASSAFDSQDVAISAEIRKKKLLRRKEAYNAAKGRNGLDWNAYSTITLAKDHDLS